MCICVHINMSTWKQENIESYSCHSEAIRTVTIIPTLGSSAYQCRTHSEAHESAASPVSTLVCYMLWSPDMMATVRICVATPRLELSICRNIPNSAYMVLSHPPSLGLALWTCLCFWGVTGLSRILRLSSFLFFWVIFSCIGLALSTSPLFLLTGTWTGAHTRHRHWLLLCLKVHEYLSSGVPARRTPFCSAS